MKFSVKVFFVFLLSLIGWSNAFCQHVFSQKYSPRNRFGARKTQAVADKKALATYIEDKLAQRFEELETIYRLYRENAWNELLGQDGSRYFIPERVEEAMRQAGFDQYHPEYAFRPVGIVFEKSIFYPEGIYYVSDTTPITDPINGVRKAKIASDEPERRHVPFAEIRREPTLLVQGAKNGKAICAVISPRYEVDLMPYCQNVKSYKQLSAKRTAALKAAGFSDDIAERYGQNNPWNLRIYNECENFDGILMVEKAVVAWRYATIANSINPNHQKDFRYVYFRQDRVQHESGTLSAEKLPKCRHFAGTSWKDREGFTSDVQPWPFEYSYSSHTPRFRDFAVDEQWNF